MHSEIEKTKQYLLMLDLVGVACLSKIIPGMQFIEVEGMEIPENKEYQLLVSPLAKSMKIEPIPTI